MPKNETKLPDVKNTAPTEAELEEEGESALDLASENAILKSQIAALMRAQAQPAQARADARADAIDPENPPVFDESEPYGLAVGDTDVAYVQNGHQFGRDKRYLATETHRGSPRAFNPRLVGVVKRPKVAPAE